MKTCARCGVDKPTTGYNRSSRNSDGLHSYCRQCQSDHYQQNRTRHMQNVRRTSKARLARYRQHIFEALKNGCVDCGNTDIRVLDFDHVRGTKVSTISRMVTYASLENVIAEIAKCEVRCKNCHAIVTLERAGGSWRDLFAGGVEAAG